MRLQRFKVFVEGEEFYAIMDYAGGIKQAAMPSFGTAAAGELRR